MLSKAITIVIGLFVIMSAATAQKPAFTAKKYGNVANYFASENGLREFFDFRKGDLVAEVGAGNGKNIIGFSIAAPDSLNFYLQDIDRRRLTPQTLQKVVHSAAKYKKSSGNSYRLCIGHETATGLPDGIFDKIILVSTLHEFTRMDEMLADIRQKLKADGLLYILETDCLTKGHKNYTSQEIINLLERNRFVPVETVIASDNRTEVYRAVFKKK